MWVGVGLHIVWNLDGITNGIKTMSKDTNGYSSVIYTVGVIIIIKIEIGVEIGLTF